MQFPIPLRPAASCRLLGILCIALAGLPACPSAWGAAPADYVIQISVDGLGASYLQRMVEENQLPNFARLESEGVWTANARNDDDLTITLPNHTTMITGRPVRDHGPRPGHLWVLNDDPGEATLHSNAHEYVPSTFDVAHDNGLSTALYASKSKFVLFEHSYQGAQGAPDETGEDNGRSKVDVCVIEEDPLKMTCRYILDMSANPVRYSFVHFRNPDTAGHASGWGGTKYQAALKQIDGYLGLILELVDRQPQLHHKTAVILTTDHGGLKKEHSENQQPYNYTIPFIVWGPHAIGGADLYAINQASRTDPGSSRGDHSPDGREPIRNGDAANLALMLLGLGPVPDSSINPHQDLTIDAAPISDAND